LTVRAARAIVAFDMLGKPARIAVLWSCLAVLSARAADRVEKADPVGKAVADAAGPRTGGFQATWPLPAEGVEFAKSFAAVARRYGVTPPLGGKGGSDRGEDDPTYEMYVPPDYAPGRPFGLLVWVGASGFGRVPGEWTKVLDEHHLIWVGPNNIGNDIPVLRRTYVTLEAVRQAKLHYTIDDERVYVSGISGGGRVASHAAILAADVFAGGFYVVGCDFWKAVPAGGKRYYPGFWRRPDTKLLRRARSTGRYVLLTGSDDFNRESTERTYDAYVADKFAHATYLEVPGMGHTHPDGEWFAKGIEALDEPLAPAGELYELAAELEEKNKLGDACLAYGRAAVRGAGESFADGAGEKADVLRKSFDQQVRRVRGLIKEANWTKAAAENTTLKARYGVLAADQSKAFADEIKKGKARRR
jgi:hypothetical protein